jgi:pilus assembly protein Flp/PilA
LSSASIYELRLKLVHDSEHPPPAAREQIQILECPMKKFFRDDQGATAIEYGLIAAAMGLALVTVMPTLRTAITTKFGNLAGHVSTGT